MTRLHISYEDASVSTYVPVETLATALFCTALALLAYCRVESVSWRLISAGEMQASIRVRLLPPRESCRGCTRIVETNKSAGIVETNGSARIVENKWKCKNC